MKALLSILALFVPLVAHSITPAILGIQSGLQKETVAYSQIVALTNAEQRTIDVDVEGVKFGPGVLVSGLTGHISRYAGYAFLQNLSTDLRWAANTGWKATIIYLVDNYDVAYCGAIGTGETVTDLITNGDNEAALNSPIEATRATTAQSNEQNHTTDGTYSEKVTSDATPNNNFGSQQLVSVDEGKLIRNTVWAYNPTAGGPPTLRSICYVGGVLIAGTPIATKDAWIAIEEGSYITALAGDNRCGGVRTENIVDPTGMFFYVDDRVVEWITAPAATGFWLNSTASGTDKTLASITGTPAPNGTFSINVTRD